MLRNLKSLSLIRPYLFDGFSLQFFFFQSQKITIGLVTTQISKLSVFPKNRNGDGIEKSFDKVLLGKNIMKKCIPVTLCLFSFRYVSVCNYYGF